MTERSKHLEEALRECAERGVAGSGDPWPDIRERLGDRRTSVGARTASAASSGPRYGPWQRPWRRGLVPRTRAGWVVAVLLLALFGTAAYAASGLIPSDLTIEEATLQRGPEGDEIVVRASATGKANLPECFLVEGPAMEAMQRQERGGKPMEGRIDSTWPDADLTESYDLGNDTVYVFHDDRDARGRKVDPERTPFFAMCTAGTEPGGTGPGVRSDVVHVEGTPGSDATLASEERDFVRKDMTSQEIRPPVATLSFGDRAMEGDPGPYCWSPGSKSEEKNTLWCWGKEENEGVPQKNKTLKVPAGSTMLFDFGGRPKPDSVVAGAYPLSYGRITGRPATGLRMREDGRLELPSDLRAGGYSVAVWVSGPKGEATYSYRIAVENGAGGHD